MRPALHVPSRPLASFLAAVLAAVPVAGEVLEVCPDGSCPFTSVRAAALAAIDGDVIKVHPGAYQPGDGDAIEVFDKSITIEGIGDAADIVLVGALGAGVIDVRSTGGDGVTVRNLTIFGGSTDVGGGLYAQGVDLVVTDCVFDRNTADVGGGLAVSGGTAVVSRCRMTVSDAIYYGAGFYCQNAVVDIENCLFDDNAAPEGAAIAAVTSAIEIRDSRFVQNLHTGGGAIISSADSSAQYPVLIDNQFCGNGYPPVVNAFIDQDGSNVFNLTCVACLASPDLLETWVDPSLDCNGDRLVDVCQIGDGTLEDRNLNEIPDLCEDPLYFDVPGIFPTISSAIAAARSGSVIRIAPGVYNEALDPGGKDLEFLGDVDAPETVILDGTGLGDSILVLAGGQTTDTLVNGLTFRFGATGHGLGVTGAAGDGGAIFLENASPRIQDCIFRDNAAGRGGAIWSNGGDPRIRRCRFEGNTATSNGGAILAKFASDLVVKDCDFVGCTAGQSGGGLNLPNCVGRIENCMIRTCLAEATGGGLLVRGSSDIALIGCTIESNAAGSEGGGIMIEPEAVVSLQDCLVYSNLPDDVNGDFVDLGGNQIGEEPAQCPEDLTGDGQVDGGDLGMLLVAMGTTCPRNDPCPEDLDANGLVDGGDIGLMLAAWGPCP